MAKKILVVDDSRAMAMKTALVLKKHGYEVDVLCEPVDTFDQLRDYPVDLLILDIEMPGLNGFQLCDELRSLPEYDHLPVLFLTSRDEHMDRLKGYSVGAQGFVNKDYDEELLVQHIGKLIMTPV